MSCAYALPWEQQVIARCSRDGHVLWPHVAAQLGISVDVARSRLDPSYARAHIWAPSREPQPEMLEIDTSEPEPSPADPPRAKRPSVKGMILARLRTEPASAETVADFVGRGLKSVRSHLSQMKTLGLVCHGNPALKPYTWWVPGGPKPEDSIDRAALAQIGPDPEHTGYRPPVYVRIKGRRLRLLDAIREYAPGMVYETVLTRIRKGWSDEAALLTPAGQLNPSVAGAKA